MEGSTAEQLDLLNQPGPAEALDASWAVWRSVAEQHLEQLAREGRRFTADDVVAAVGLPPVTGSPNAVGGLFAKARAAGLIVAVGYTSSVRGGRRGGSLRVWQGARP